MNRRRTVLRSFLFVLTAVVAAAGCSGSHGGGAGPTPTPTPASVTFSLDGAPADYSSGAVWSLSTGTCTIYGQKSAADTAHDAIQITVPRPCQGSHTCTHQPGPTASLLFDDASGVAFVTADSSATCTVNVTVADTNGTGALSATFSGTVVKLGGGASHAITNGQASVPQL